MNSPRIPIRNLYYLLCYSWDQLAQGQLVDVSRLPTTNLVDLFALILCDGIYHLARRGLEQGYETREDELAGVRGRIDILRSARRFLPAHGRAACLFDELTINTLANQILKSTLRRLEHAQGLNRELRKRIHVLHRNLHDVHDIALTSQSFRKIQLHANNRFYRFLLNVCELIHGSWLPNQEAGGHKFRDFVRDERIMALVFQNFLFNFIRIEIPSWEIRREYITWRAESITDLDLMLLPRLETDISLKRGTDHLIIDAKYYQNTLAQRYDTSKIHSGNLYQLLTYLSNARRPSGDTLRGMLIYPRVDRTLREYYTIQGYGITVATVDLSQTWEGVRAEIFDLFV